MNITINRVEEIGKIFDKPPIEIMALDESMTIYSNNQQGGQANIENLTYPFFEKERML